MALDTGKAHLIHNLNQHAGFGFAVGLNNRTALRVFGMQFFYIGTHRGKVDLPPVNPDFIIVTNGNENGHTVLLDRSFRIGAGDINAAFLNEGCRDDKENQHDEHDIQHRCDIDISVFFLSHFTAHSGAPS